MQSESSSQNDSELSSESDSEYEYDEQSQNNRSSQIKNAASLMYTLTLDPQYDKSDHSSDDEICSSRSLDTELESLSGDPISVELGTENNDQDQPECSCGECAGEGYCCNGIEISKRICEQDEVLCITNTRKFTDCIFNADVLELMTYAIDKIKLEKHTIESKNRQLRYTGYYCFFKMLELNGLGKGNRYELQSCVLNSVREKYPSPSGNYTGFKPGESSNTLLGF